jgi:hypothetical protein
MTVYGQDWASYQSSRPSTKGLDFVFVKATEGTGYVNPRMISQASHARAAGCVVGFYHFLRPGNIRGQARFFVEKAASLHGDPLWADWEDPGVSCHDKDTFIREVQRLRGDTHRVGLYCNTNYWWTRDTTSFCGDALWIATYNGRPGHPGIRNEWKFHQYTSTPVDKNYGAFRDRAALRAWAEKGSASHTSAVKEDDMPDVKDIVKALAKTDGVFDVGDKMKRSDPDNGEWQLESILAFIGDRAVDNMDAINALDEKVHALSAKVDSLDLSGLVTALESLKLRIDVAE